MRDVVSYMGTKHALASRVAEIVGALPRGPLLDVFAGMGAVGSAVGVGRPVWTNDWMEFPSLVCRSLLSSPCGSLSRDEVDNVLGVHFQANRRLLRKRFADQLAAEEKAIASGCLREMPATSADVPFVGTCEALERERSRLARKPDTYPYRMATISYAGGFFGLSQSVDLDSVRFAIDRSYSQGEIKPAKRDRLLVALASAAARVNSSTGHFAQYMKPNDRNINRFLQKRRRSVWQDFLDAAASIEPVGTVRWRRTNRAFRRDAVDLLAELRRSGSGPAVVYADPPYSKAQYSRYYHVLEELILYRYPRISGVGRYPPGRRTSKYGLSGRVAQETTRLVREAASLDAALVFSYPSNGLLETRGEGVRRILSERYAKVELAYSRNHQHSTFGASRTSASNIVRERVYIATN